MMKTNGFFIQVVIFVLMVALISACGPAQASPTPIPPTATAEPTPIPVKPTATTASPPAFDITFDGNECNIVGPETIPQGKVTFIMHNLGDEELRVDIIKIIDEGKTWEDFVEFFGPPGSEKSGGSFWMQLAGEGVAFAGQTSEYSPFLMKGEYGLDCVLWRMGHPGRHWIGAPLTVE